MTELNLNNLEEEFDMNFSDIISENNERNDYNKDEPEVILRKNIDRANEMIDMLMNQLSQGNITARLVEVAANLVNGVTASAKELQNEVLQNKSLLLRAKMIQLKEREVVVKEKKLVSSSNRHVTNQNLIISSREDILKLLESDSECESKEIKE